MSQNIYVGKLVEQYTKTEYLQSSGTQYIDTGYKPGGNTRVVCEFSRIARSGSGIGAALFGARRAKNNYDYTFWGYNYQDEVNFADNYYSTNQTITVPTTERILVDKNKNVTTINNSSSVTHSFYNFGSVYNMYIFATNKAGSPDTAQMGSLRIYYMKIYNNDVLVRDFVPVVDINGTPGLLDLVNKVFYSNRGSGTFSTGQISNEIVYERHVSKIVKSIYVGINGVAKKIKRGYIGINGVARECWGRVRTPKIKSAPSLQSATTGAGSTTFNNLAMYAGGQYGASNYYVLNKVVGFTPTLTQVTSIANLSQSRSNIGGGSTQNYALFAGGSFFDYDHTTSVLSIDIYDKNFAKKTDVNLNLTTNFGWVTGTTFNNLACFGGVDSKIFECFNDNFTKTQFTWNSNAGGPNFKTFGEYLVITSREGTIHIYDKNFTNVSILSDIDTSSYSDQKIDGNSQFCFISTSISNVNKNYYLDKNLVRSSLGSLPNVVDPFEVGSIKDYFFVIGGTSYNTSTYITTYYNTIYIFSPNLTKLDQTLALSSARYGLKKTNIGDYILLAGGYTIDSNNNMSVKNTVDAIYVE